MDIEARAITNFQPNQQSIFKGTDEKDEAERLLQNFLSWFLLALPKVSTCHLQMQEQIALLQEHSNRQLQAIHGH